LGIATKKASQNSYAEHLDAMAFGTYMFDIKRETTHCCNTIYPIGCSSVADGIVHDAARIVV